MLGMGRRVLVLVAAAAALACPWRAAAVGDADVFVLTGVVTSFTQPVDALGAETGMLYTMSGTCVQTSVLGVTLPTFEDVPPDESGTCGGLSGSGTMDAVSVGNGAAFGNLSINEPSGSASMSYTMVFVAGIAVLAAPQAYVDEGTGSAFGVFQMTPTIQGGVNLEISGYTFTGVLVAEY